VLPVQGSHAASGAVDEYSATVEWCWQRESGEIQRKIPSSANICIIIVTLIGYSPM
jgi:hypothetical protein